MGMQAVRRIAAGGRRGIAIVAGAAAAAALAAPGGAAADDDMGIYRVKSGVLKQNFQYIASSYSVEHASGDCWEHHYNSQGNGSWDLKAVAKATYKKVDGNVVKPAFDNGVFKLKGLGWSGPVTRNTAINTKTVPGAGFDDDCDPPVIEPPETASCGSDSVSGYVTPNLVPYSRRIPILDNTAGSGDRLGLFGPMPQALGNGLCPSESTFASLFGGGRGDLSVSDEKLKAFERFKDHIQMSGKSEYSGNKYFFFAGFEDGSGSQQASTKWSLDLKCVKRC